MPQWLVVSIVLSIVLTVVVNVVLRLFPDAGTRLFDSIARMAHDPAENRAAQPGDRSRARVIVPWKLMLIGSIALTIALNVWLAIAR